MVIVTAFNVLVVHQGHREGIVLLYNQGIVKKSVATITRPVYASFLKPLNRSSSLYKLLPLMSAQKMLRLARRPMILSYAYFSFAFCATFRELSQKLTPQTPAPVELMGPSRLHFVRPDLFPSPCDDEASWQPFLPFCVAFSASSPPHSPPLSMRPQKGLLWICSLTSFS